MTNDEREDPRKYSTSVKIKRKQNSETCTDCGHLFNRDGLPDWGRGCASECSISQCDLGEIWDWTRRACVACDALRNGSLCTSDAWKYMKNEDVSGHRAKIAFGDCVAKPNFGATDKMYGDCSSCREKYISESCDAPVAAPQTWWAATRKNRAAVRGKGWRILLGDGAYDDGEEG